MAAAAFANNQVFHGLRQINLRTDLAQLAELLEVCFGPTMDEAGRAMIREYRMVGQSGSLTLLMHGLDRLLGGIEQGYVWTENGHLVGNVSVTPANMPRSMGSIYIIANVAVHPDYRRRGLAQAMLMASLDLIRHKGGDMAILQVDSDNEGAHRLYSRLGFRDERTFSRWQRSSHLRAPERLPDMPFMTLRQPNEWRSEYALATLVRPNERGGRAWLKPTHPDLFKPSFWRSLVAWTSAASEEHWIIRDDSQKNIVASMRATMSFGGGDRLEKLVHPGYQGRYEEVLLNYALRRLEGHRRPTVIEHPADDTVTIDLLEKYQFARRGQSISMRCDFRSRIP